MSKSNGNVLVTGGAGFIGSHLVPLLISHNYSVTVLDNLSTGKLENLQEVVGNPKFKFVRGDICEPKSIQEALQNVNAVVHLAALIEVSVSVADPFQTNNINVTGTLNVLNEAVKANVEKFVFASSTAIYGDTKTLPVGEDTIPKPISPYAASKAAGENYLTAFNACYGINTVALRFFNVYGPKNEISSYSGVITKFLKKALNDEPLTIEGDGEQTRDFIYVDDIAQALKKALEAQNVAGESFNICTGKPTSINQLAEVISEITGKALTKICAPQRVGDVKHSYGDPVKASKQLGFTSKIDILEGIKQVITYF